MAKAKDKRVPATRKTAKRPKTLEARSFPGWENFGAMLSHLRFVRDHHRQIRRIAVVSDSKILAVAPKIASHFVSAEVRSFDAGDRAAARAWIEAPQT